MPKNDVWFEVYLSFLKDVYFRLREMNEQIEYSYKGSIPEKSQHIIDEFRKYHPLDGGPGKMYREYFRTNLIHKIEGERNKVMMFGFLRTLFLGILRGRPKINVFTRRVSRYKATHYLAKSLEDFLKLYRRRIGFDITQLSRKTLRSSGKISHCSGLPESNCLKPMCVYIRPEDPSREGFCKRFTQKRDSSSSRSRSRSVSGRNVSE